MEQWEVGSQWEKCDGQIGVGEGETGWYAAGRRDAFGQKCVWDVLGRTEEGNWHSHVPLGCWWQCGRCSENWLYSVAQNLRKHSVLQSWSGCFICTLHVDSRSIINLYWLQCKVRHWAWTVMSLAWHKSFNFSAVERVEDAVWIICQGCGELHCNSKP